MPFTSRGYIYEAPGDEPLRSLTGGSSGTSPILAEQLNDDIDNIEGTVIGGIEARLQVVEAAVAASRWRHITSGSQSVAGDFILTVPSGYERLRLTLVGDMDNTGNVHLRINDDATSGRHRYGYVQINGAGSVEVPDYADSTSWRLAEWATVESNTLIVEIWPTDGGPPSGAGNVAYQAWGHRDSTSASTHRQFLGWGKYQQDAIVSSLRVMDVTAGFVEVRWWLEGYVSA